MRSWWNKKQLGILCGTGLLAAGYLLGMTGVLSGDVKAQPKPADPRPALRDLPPTTVAADSVITHADTVAAPDALAGRPLRGSSPTAGSSIEQLVEQLQNLRARKAELDRQEKQVVSALKDKLKEQQERLQKLGINTPPPAVPASVSNDRSNAPFETGSLKLAESRDGGTKK